MTASPRTKVADFIAETIAGLGVRHVFGVGGANIEDVFAAVQRRRPEVRVVLNKHEHAAGTAADAYARISRNTGVVLVTSGGGAMNLVHAMAEARTSRVPLLAIVGEPPTAQQGAGAFQDTSGRNGAIDAAAVFGAVAAFCARVERADDVPRLLSAAIRVASGPVPGPAVLLIAKDLQQAELSVRGEAPEASDLVRPIGVDPESVRRAAERLRSGPVVVIAGDEVSRAGARPALSRVVAALDARVCTTPDGRDAFDNGSTRFLGVCGAMGTKAVADAIDEASACLLVGTRLPLLARQGLEPILARKPSVAVARERPFLALESAMHLNGDIDGTLRALGNELGAPDSEESASLPSPPRLDEGGPFTTRIALSVIERQLVDGSVVIADAGNTGAAVAHQLRVPREGRFLLAMGMAGMGYAFGAAVGAALASGRRCTVLAGDGAFYMHGLDVHTAVEHALPITYIVFDNRAHGMCLVRERLLLGENAGYNAFRRSHIGTGASAMFPRLFACDCCNARQLFVALERANAEPGPSLISVEFAEVEIPPFRAFDAVNERGLRTVPRGAWP